MLKFRIIAVFLFILLAPGAVFTKSAGKEKSGTVYVPVYSSIYHGDKNREFDLAVTLSIRNIDLKQTLTVKSVDYHDTSGKLVRSYVREHRRIKPIETLTFVIKESDLTGGPGASFMVRWSGEKAANEPIIESIMIGTKGQQGISFTSRGRRILE